MKTMSIFLRLIPAVFIACFLFSCASIQRDIAYESLPGAKAEDLGRLELELVRLRANPDAKALAAARSNLEELAKTPNTDPLYRARLFALDSEAALLAGKPNEAEKKLAQSRAQYPGDELALLVESRLEPSPEKKLALLEAAIAKADISDRLTAEKAAILLETGNYRQALALFDASLPRLPAEYLLLFSPFRDKAYALRDLDGKIAGSSAAYLSAKPLSLIGMVIVTQQETALLDWFTGGATWAPGVLFERLKGAGWFSDQASKPESTGTRKDAALFLWQLLSRGKSEMLKRYSARYASSAASPVPDVAYGKAWFDATLGIVEEGIMNLPDGKNFIPEEEISGLDFFAALSAAAKFK